jgi:hypothetical protein
LINLYLDGSSVTVLLATDGTMIAHQQWSHGLVHNQIDHLLRNLDHLKVEQRFSVRPWWQVHLIDSVHFSWQEAGDLQAFGLD